MRKINKIILENEKYQITEGALNYIIDFKLKADGVGMSKGKKVKALPYPFYSSLERGLDEAIDLAEGTIENYHEDNQKVVDWEATQNATR